MRSVAVTESSQIAEARRHASDIASSRGADETTVGRVALVATELATNVLKHGGGGELLLASYGDALQGGVELIALDRGRGIANLQESLRDGHSTAGSAGLGLGAIRRQSQVMEVASWPALGTAILARIDTGSTAAATEQPLSGCVSVPKRGEDVCGDECCVVETAAGRTALVVDGLGHGPDAAIAAAEAVRLFRRHQGLPVPTILEYLHAGLRATRGAAVAVLRMDPGGTKVVYGGIGNISGAIMNGTEIRRMISLNGTAGHVARRIQTFDYPFTAGVVVMYSDGLQTTWSLERYAGITRMHPTLLAAVAYRDFSRHRDDATVLVLKHGGSA